MKCVLVPMWIVIISMMIFPNSTRKENFPVKPILFVDGTFVQAEGISFNGEGDLFVTANKAFWRLDTKGNATKLADLHTNLGVAAIGKRDLLVADFGPTNRFSDGPNCDGIVWRITPDGKKRIAATGGMGDPNFIVVRDDGSYLVSDDATNEIFLVSREGNVELFTDAVRHPNGMVISPDGRSLYVAQIFKRLKPFAADNRVWRIPLNEKGDPQGDPAVVMKIDKENAGLDGLAMDSLGRLYVTAPMLGQIWRLDPRNGDCLLIAEGMPGIASIAFGQGRFDHHALYGASTRRGGGRIWKINVGIGGVSHVSKKNTSAQNKKILKHAREIAKRILLIDCHSHNLLQPETPEKQKQVSFPMLEEGGVNGMVQVFPLNFRAIKNPSRDIFNNIIDTRNHIKNDLLNVSIILRSTDFKKSFEKESVAILLGIEYFKGIFDGNVGMVQKYYDAGVREIGLVRTGLSDVIFEDERLTEFGSEIISEMNRMGMICDITHLPEWAQREVIETSEAPVILSHTNAYRVINSGFNATDNTLERLVNRGGIVCVTFFSGQLSNKALDHMKQKKGIRQMPKAHIRELVDQIDYLRHKVGIGFIGIGSDFGGSGRSGPEGLETVSGFPLIIYHLLKRNYSEDEIAKIMGLNFVRFFERVEHQTLSNLKRSFDDN